MVAIRLRREGTIHRPYYRVVVTDSRARRDGRFIEDVGTYDPMNKAAVNYQVKLERIDAWVKNGAQPSETVASIVKKARKAAAGAAPAAKLAKSA
jgi:small subunit ribosomal protein S16